MRIRVIFQLLAMMAACAFATIHPCWAAKLGADKAAPFVADALGVLPFEKADTYILDGAQTAKLFALAAELQINVFELIDASYRYLAPRGLRMSLLGTTLRTVESRFDFGRERVRSLLPIDTMISLEVGAVQKAGQKAMDVRLSAGREEYIEIGTAVYETRFGFSRLSPLLFDGAYGVKVKRFLFATDLDKLELYEPGKGAIWVKGLGRPKKWNLWVVRRLDIQSSQEEPDDASPGAESG